MIYQVNKAEMWIYNLELLLFAKKYILLESEGKKSFALILSDEN